MNRAGRADYLKGYYEENKESILVRSKNYRENNKEKILAQKKAYRDRHKNTIRAQQRVHYKKNKTKVCERNLRWRKANKDKVRIYINKYRKKRYHNDPLFRLETILRTRLKTFLKQNNCRKGGRSFEIFGATPEQIKSHIESKFKDDMTWENHGEWHIDHIIPLDYYAKNFDLNNLEVQKKAFNYKNLQPLWAFENLSKSNKCETLELVK